MLSRAIRVIILLLQSFLRRGQGVVARFGVFLILSRFDRRGVFGGGGLPGYLRVAFPVLRIDRLGEFLEVSQKMQLAHTGNLILDAGWKPMVKLMVKGRFTPLTDRGEAGEVNQIFGDPMVFFHVEMLELQLGISDDIIRSEIGLQLADKLHIV